MQRASERTSRFSALDSRLSSLQSRLLFEPLEKETVLGMEEVV